jgi:hypothetical protein
MKGKFTHIIISFTPPIIMLPLPRWHYFLEKFLPLGIMHKRREKDKESKF